MSILDGNSKVVRMLRFVAPDLSGVWLSGSVVTHCSIFHEEEPSNVWRPEKWTAWSIVWFFVSWLLLLIWLQSNDFFFFTSAGECEPEFKKNIFWKSDRMEENLGSCIISGTQHRMCNSQKMKAVNTVLLKKWMWLLLLAYTALMHKNEWLLRDWEYPAVTHP